MDPVTLAIGFGSSIQTFIMTINCNTRSVGRCWGFIYGNSIFLTNFYSNWWFFRVASVYISAIRKLLGIPGMELQRKFVGGFVDIPVHADGNAFVLYGDLGSPCLKNKFRIPNFTVRDDSCKVCMLEGVGRGNIFCKFCAPEMENAFI